VLRKELTGKVEQVELEEANVEEVKEQSV